MFVSRLRDGGGRVGGTSRWANVGGADTGDDDVGVSLIEADANGEQHYPCQGQARSGGGGCCQCITGR
jgi:hypothetical protein